MSTTVPEATEYYVEREHELDALESHLDSDDPPLVVTGPTGCGKTTLLASWVRRLAERSPSLPVVWYGAEESFRDANVKVLAERVSEAARETLMRRKLVFERLSHYDRDRAQALCLAVPDSTRLIVVIDGLDHVHHPYRTVDMSWLPVQVPSHVRLVVSVSNPRWRRLLEGRGWQTHEISEFGVPERRKLLHRLGTGHAGTADASRSARPEACAELPWAGNPLRLLQSVAMMGPSQPSSYRELVQQALERWEAGEDTDARRQLATLLTVSRIGCHTVFARELMERSYPPSLESRCRARLEGLAPIVIERASLYRPADEEVRAVFADRYLATERQKKTAHQRAAQALAAHSDTPLLCVERAYHLRAAEEWDELARFISDIDCFEALRAWDSGLLTRLWVALQGRHDAVECYRRSLESHEQRVSPMSLVPQLNNLGVYFNDWLGRSDVAEELYRRSAALADRVLDPGSGKAATARNNLAALLTDKPGGETESEALFERVLAAHAGPGEAAENCPSQSVILRLYFDLLLQKGERTRAEKCLVRALEIDESRLGPHHPAITDTLFRSVKLFRETEPQKALLLAQRGARIRERVYGLDDHGSAYALRQVAGALDWCGQRDAAEETYRRALEWHRAAPTPDRCSEAWCIYCIGNLRALDGDDEEAFRCWHTAAELWEQALGAKHELLGSRLNSLGLEYDYRDRIDEAARLYEQAWVIARVANGDREPLDSRQRTNLARALSELGDVSKAEELIRKIAAMDEATLGPDHRDLGTDLLILASIKRMQQDFAAARELLERAAQIFGNGEPTTRWGVVQLALGLTLAGLGESDRSARHHEAGLSLATRGERHHLRTVSAQYRALAGQSTLAAALRRVAVVRAEQIDRLSRTSVMHTPLTALHLPFRPVRTAWHPSRPLLAVAGCHGQVRVLHWHADGRLLEEIQAFATQAATPESPPKAAEGAACALNWSPVGSRLRVRSAGGIEEVLGVASRIEEGGSRCWAPASPVSADGAWLAMLRKDELRIFSGGGDAAAGTSDARVGHTRSAVA